MSCIGLLHPLNYNYYLDMQTCGKKRRREEEYQRHHEPKGMKIATAIMSALRDRMVHKTPTWCFLTYFCVAVRTWESSIEEKSNLKVARKSSRACLPILPGWLLNSGLGLSMRPSEKGKLCDADQSREWVYLKRSKRTSKSFGVFLLSGSFNRQLSINISASFEYLPSGVNRGAGSLTICCSSSKILIVIPPPCKLTPLLFRLSFFGVFLLIRAGGRPESESDPGRAGDRVPSKSESPPSSSDTDSEKGKRPRASSIKEMPSDHTSDLTVYGAPCIRSGYRK